MTSQSHVQTQAKLKVWHFVDVFFSRNRLRFLRVKVIFPVFFSVSGQVQRDMESNGGNDRTHKNVERNTRAVIDYYKREEECKEKSAAMCVQNDVDEVSTTKPKYSVDQSVEEERRQMYRSRENSEEQYRSRENSEEQHVNHLQRQMELQNQLISSLQEQLKIQSNVSERNAERLHNLLRESEKREEKRKEEEEEKRRRQARDRYDNHFRESSTFQPVSPSNNFESPSYRNAKDKYWNRIQSNAKSTYDELDHLAESYTETEYDYGEYGDDDGPVTVSGVPII